MNKMIKIDQNLLKKRVEESRLTQAELANQAGLSRNTIPNIVSGTTLPSLYAMRQTSYVLKLTSKDALAIFFMDHPFDDEDSPITT